jgi:outer membrane protein OmpA-like peptidoglycan-associated protein
MSTARRLTGSRNKEFSVRLAPPTCLLLALSSCAMMPASQAPSYVVFFTEHSTALDPAASQVIAQAADAARATPAATVRVIGYTDSVGIPSADVVLSQQRAAIVAQTLIADGVAASRIVQQGRGQTHEDPGVASRRVDIEIGQ